MKKALIGILALCLVSAALLTGCGEQSTTVKSVGLNESQHIIVEYNDGTTQDFGLVSVSSTEVKSIRITDDLHAVIVFTDDTEQDFGYVGVVDESKNITIRSADVNSDLHLIITYSDGRTEDKGYVGVADASQGVAVASTEVNSDFHLIITYSDGRTEDKGYVGVVDASQVVTVASTEIDDQKHLIITYSDGKTEDLGYVGVSVEPQLFEVRFYDLSDHLLSEQEVYEGRSAKAPEAPVVADKTFIAWDTDYSAVKSNLTIHPVYSDAERYTVIFKDSDGTELKTETVVSGHSATAPATPLKDNEVFVKWDKDFSRVSSNLTITAVYREKNTYKVTFVDYSGLSLGATSVKEGDAAVAPVTPTREGYSFTGWSSSISSISSDKTVTAQYKLNSGTNIMDLSYTINGSNLTVKVTMKGTVRFCGMEGSIIVPAGLTYVSAQDGDGTVTNYNDGTIYYLFTSSNGKDVTSETVITTLTFTVAGNAGNTVQLATTISDIYDQDYVDVAKTVIGQDIRVKN